MLNIVKLALRIVTNAFDAELQLLIDDCIAEMEGMGITNISTTEGNTTTYDPQAQIAIISYCKWKFGNNEDAEKWDAIYHEKVGQLKILTGHTEW